jgi:hypothetical protein
MELDIDIYTPSIACIFFKESGILKSEESRMNHKKAQSDGFM